MKITDSSWSTYGVGLLRTLPKNGGNDLALNFRFSHFCARLTGAAAAEQRQQRAVLEDDSLCVAGGRRQTRHAEKHRRLRYADPLFYLYRTCKQQ